ncbi:hypothetical protein [Yoonia sp. 2307UL14-13]|uniref:hypothetical protein n=1 Tax=Yoonia sp. 2307UL14-13 TaxID=3126506 RepID=UPI0030A4F193
MSDSLGVGACNPTAAQIRLDERWAVAIGYRRIAVRGDVTCGYSSPAEPLLPAPLGWRSAATNRLESGLTPKDALHVV